MHVKTAADLGRVIREARVRARMSQTTLATRFGTTQSWVSEVENGKETAEIGKVLNVLSYLNLRLDLSDGRSRRPASSDDALINDFPDIDDIIDGGGMRP